MAFMLCVLVTWRLVTILAAKEARGISLLSSLPEKEGRNGSGICTEMICASILPPNTKASF